MDRRKATAKLFEMVQRGQTDNILKFLERGANINGRDKDGNTPLIIAARNRNYVLQDLLLSRGADVRKADKSGRTALHHESWAGDLECVNLLLANGAKVDAQDSEGRTPLLFAVNAGHFKVADILVFCGADGSIKATDGKSPTSICKRADFKALMKESKQIVEGIRNGLVKIQQRVLRPKEGLQETEIELPEVGLSIRVKSQSLGRGVGLLMRRVPPELSRSSLSPSDKELLLSDTFEYRLATASIDGGAMVTIPVFSEPTIFESAFIKTNILPDVDETIIDPISDFHTENQGDIYEEKVTCTTHVDLAHVSAFLMVAQIRVEHFPMTSKGGLVTSEIDDSVQINVPEKCFGDQGDVTLEIIPRPLIKPDEFPHLVAISHFYDVKHSEGEQPSKAVTLHLPLPRTFTGDGNLVALLRRSTDGPDDDDDDKHVYEDDFEKEVDLWDLVDDNPSRDAKRAKFDLPHFSAACILEAKDGTKEDKIKETAEKVFKKAKLWEKQVSFDAFLRHAVKDNNTAGATGGEFKQVGEVAGVDEAWEPLYDVVVTCSELKQLHRTKDFFQYDGYKHLQQARPDGNERIVVPGQLFSIEPGEGNFEKTDNIHHPMEFHPKREHKNRVKMTLTPKDMEKDLIGLMLVDQDKPKEGKMQREEFIDVKLEINVERDFTQEDNRFMNDKFMDRLADKVHKDFNKFLQNLGLSKTTIRRVGKNRKSMAVSKMLRLWRGKCQSRVDLGLPGLLYALGKTDRKDLQEDVVQQLKKWLNVGAEESTFKTWAKAEVVAPSYDAAKDVGRPMSDDYLQWVVCEMGERPDIRGLASRLSIPLLQVEYIEQDPFAKGKLWQVLKLLKMSRDRHDSHVSAFEALMQELTEQRYEDIREEAIRKAKKWADCMTRETADPFAHLLESLLHEELYAVPEPETNDNDVDYSSRPVSRNMGTPASRGTTKTPRRDRPDKVKGNRGAKGSKQGRERRSSSIEEESGSSRSSSASSEEYASEDKKRDKEKKEKKHRDKRSATGGKRGSSPSSTPGSSSKGFETTARGSHDEEERKGGKKGTASKSKRRGSLSSNYSTSSNSSDSATRESDEEEETRDGKRQTVPGGKRSQRSRSRSNEPRKSSDSSQRKPDERKEDLENKHSSEDKTKRSSGGSNRSKKSKGETDRKGGKRNEERSVSGDKGKLSSGRSSSASTKEDQDKQSHSSRRSSSPVSKDVSDESKKETDDKEEKKYDEGETTSEDRRSRSSRSSSSTSTRRGSSDRSSKEHHDKDGVKDDPRRSVSSDVRRRRSRSNSSDSSSSSSDRLSTPTKERKEDSNSVRGSDANNARNEKLSSASTSHGESDTERDRDKDSSQSSRNRTSVKSETVSDTRKGVQGDLTARTNSRTSLNSKRSQESSTARKSSEDGEVEHLRVDTPEHGESDDGNDDARTEEQRSDNDDKHSGSFVFEEEKSNDEERKEKKSIASEKTSSRRGSSSSSSITIESRGRRSDDGSKSDANDVAA